MDTAKSVPTETSDAAIESVVAQLRDTFNRGKTRPLSWRIGQLEAMKTMLQNHHEEFTHALKSDTGRPL